jgi:hypothetical protein
MRSDRWPNGFILGVGPRLIPLVWLVGIPCASILRWVRCGEGCLQDGQGVRRRSSGLAMLAHQLATGTCEVRIVGRSP